MFAGVGLQYPCTDAAGVAGCARYTAFCRTTSCGRRAFRYPRGVIDTADRAILNYLRTDGRATVAEIAASVSLSPAAVSRRLARLESSGVIKGYVAIVDDTRAGGLEAFIEVRMVGAVDADELADMARGIPRILEFYNVAGDPDLLMRLRVDDRQELAGVVNALRRSGKVAGTKTLIVLDSWSRAASRPDVDLVLGEGGTLSRRPVLSDGPRGGRPGARRSS